MTKILVAEDERDLRTLISLGLRMHHIEATVVADGSEAVTAAKRDDFDLILLDLNMPHLDGLDAAKQIRRLPGYAATPLLFLSGDIGLEDRVLLDNSDLLIKPFTIGILVEHINLLCSRTAV